jgi:hypothetical protein
MNEEQVADLIYVMFALEDDMDKEEYLQLRKDYALQKIRNNYKEAIDVIVAAGQEYDLID